MKIIIKNIIIEGDAKEIAALMFPAQERQEKIMFSLDGSKRGADDLVKEYDQSAHSGCYA